MQEGSRETRVDVFQLTFGAQLSRCGNPPNLPVAGRLAS